MTKTELECLDFIATAVFTLDIDDHGQPVYSAFNRFAQEAAGLSPKDVLGKTAKEVYPGPGGESAYARHMEILKTGIAQEYQVRLPLRSELRAIRTTLVPVKDASGAVVRLIGTSNDVTAEEMARRDRKNAKAISQEMEDFITMAAHDLRTPMRNVHHIADMMRDEFEDLGDGKIDLINLLEDVAVKATSLISDVLAHAQATKAKEEIMTFEFNALCQELCDVLDPLGQHKVTISEGLVTGDKTAYQIVIRNLLDNAFKHGGRDTLSLSIELSPASDTMMTVIVRDDGRGFENPGVAFLESGKMRTDSGFGLLGIRRLIQSRGGKICAETPAIGRGSVIKFTLPGEVTYPADIAIQRLASSGS